jgi:hypothetical protein
MQRRRPGYVLAAVVISLVTGLSACSDGGETASPTSTTVAGPAGSAPEAGGCPTFRGATGPRASVGPTAPGLLIDATAGGVGCLDRVEFTFRSQGDGTVAGQGLAPSYTVEYAEDGIFMNGDAPTAVPGAAWLLVTMKPASSYEPNPDPKAKKVPTYLGNLRLRWDTYNHLQVVQRLEDVDDSVQWVISLDGTRPFVVDAARDPTRITIWIG